MVFNEFLTPLIATRSKIEEQPTKVLVNWRLRLELGISCLYGITKMHIGTKDCFSIRTFTIFHEERSSSPEAANARGLEERPRRTGRLGEPGGLSRMIRQVAPSIISGFLSLFAAGGGGGGCGCCCWFISIEMSPPYWWGIGEVGRIRMN